MALPPSLTVIRSSVVALVVAVGVSAGTLVASTGGSVSARSITTASFQGVTAGQPDIILILTDDQRFDTLWAMPTVRSQLVAKGVSFSNGYVSNPVCCPSRSSTLTGQYSHTTRVYTNHPKEPFGGFPAFDDRSTVATWLQQAGYRTALMGKYLNGYGESYVPPGWDRWFVTWDEGAYFDYSANDDGVIRNFGADPKDYGTDVLDSSLLRMSNSGFIVPTDPMWLSTLDAMSTELVTDSLVYRYDPAASPDGLRGSEGTFSLCTFNYAEALARSGRVDQARMTFAKMLTYANHLGLYSEEIALTGEQIGNFPQAFTHLALINAALVLDARL